jgi:signal transduction histidine kinase
MASKRNTEEGVLHERFFELYDRMLGQESLPNVLDQLSQVVCDVMHAEGTTVYLVREATQELEGSALVHNVRRKILIPISHASLAGYCALSGEAFLIPDASGDLSHISPDLRFDDTWDKALNYRTRDVMCAPALFKGATVGVVQVLNARGTTFNEADLQAIRSTARLVGYALHHARVYDDLASMKKLQHEKARFMSVMVHELKSPLAAARLMTYTMHQKYVPEDRHEEQLGKIVGRLDGMLGMIGDTLTLSRLEAGDVLGDICLVDIRETAAENGKLYEEHAQAKGLAFELHMPDDPVNVRIDTQGLKLIMSNLMSNAIKYTAEGSIRVQVSEAEGLAVFSVQDTGMGVPADDIPKLFRGFFRASNARSSTIEGSGVGLAGVKSMVERFGGELRLETTEGEGSTFSVHLPSNRFTHP